MTKQINSSFEREKGQSLLAALVLAAVLMLLGYTLIKLNTYQSRMTTETKRKDRLFGAADAALQRALAVLVKDNYTGGYNLENWNNVGTGAGLAGYGSLTYSGTVDGVTAPFTEIPGIQYWVCVLPGELVDPRGDTPPANDTAIKLWANMGDLDEDRTIFVRVSETVSVQAEQGKPAFREDVFYITVHRTDVTYVPGDTGLSTTGCMDLGTSWSGDTFTSCNGLYGGTNHSGTGGTVGSGTVQSPCISGGSTDFGLSKINQPLNPPPPPASTFLAAETNINPPYTFVGPLADVTANTIIANTVSTDGTVWTNFRGGGAYRIDDMVTTGNKVIQIDISRGYAHVYVYGTLSLGGNIDLPVISPTANVKIDDFEVAATYNTSNLNNVTALGVKYSSGYVNYTGPTTQLNTNAAGTGTDVAMTSVINSVTYKHLRLAATDSSFYWWSYVAPTPSDPVSVQDLRGYRVLRFNARGAVGGEDFEAGLVFKFPGHSEEVTTTAKVSLLGQGAIPSPTANPPIKSFYVDFADLTDQPAFLAIYTPLNLPYPPEYYVRRVVFRNFNAGNIVDIDDVYIHRYAGSYCCGTEDAVIYELNGNDVTLSGNGDYQCLLYCPLSDASVQGGGNGYFSGAIIAKSFDTSGGGSGWFHYDSCLAKKAAEAYKMPPVITTQWRQVGEKY